MQAEAQRNRERKELEDRVSVRLALLEQKVRLFVPQVILVTDSKIFRELYKL